MEVEKPHPDQINKNPTPVNEQEAVEKLKNADWTSPEKGNESFENNNYQLENPRQRNIVHQKKGDAVQSRLSKSNR